MNKIILFWECCSMLVEPVFSVLMATGVVLFHNPSQTSPNWPCPSFRMNFKLVRSISQWSLVLCDRPSVAGFSIWGVGGKSTDNR